MHGTVDVLLKAVSSYLIQRALNLSDSTSFDDLQYFLNKASFQIDLMQYVSDLF